MAEVISQSTLRNDNASVMRRVAAGESFVVTVHGRPVADVRPHRASGTQRCFVPVGELAELFVNGTPVDAQAWRRDLDELRGDLDDDVVTDPFDPGS